jgi:hypothetical protein
VAAWKQRRARSACHKFWKDWQRLKGATITATAQLIDHVRRLSPDDLAALTDEELADVHTLLLEAEHDHIHSLCAQEVAPFEAGPLYWATTHTATENPHWKEQGLPFIAPFPK